jgi:glycosyltransferase involved in cell wall biosynthesis
LRQQGIPAKILVVDDGSRDGSLTLLRQLEALYYADGLHVLALKRNGGLSKARNRILLNSANRFVLFLDADNEVISENIHHFYRAIVQTKAAVVYGKLVTVAHGEPLGELSWDSFQDRMFSRNYVDAFSLIDRIQVLDCGGFSDLLKGREDWELNLHLATQGRRIVYVPTLLGIYYCLSGSMSEGTKERVFESDPNDIERPLYVRVYNQHGIRESMPLNTRNLRYHPDPGYF